jgi:hypothetical protein
MKAAALTVRAVHQVNESLASSSSEMMRRGQGAGWTLAVLAAGALGVVLGGCAARREFPSPDLSLGQRIAVRTCDEDGARVELIGAEPDTFHYKPMLEREHYLVDLRARSDAESWLIVNDEAAPTGVDSVSGAATGWLLGDLRAYFIPRAGDLTLRDLHVNVGDGDKLPVVLARISVDGRTPQRWVEEGGEVDHRVTFGRKLVPLTIEVECVSWFDVHAPAHAASP